MECFEKWWAENHDEWSYDVGATAKAAWEAALKAKKDDGSKVPCGVMHNPDYFKEMCLCQPSEIFPCPRCKEPLIEKPETQNIRRYFVCPKCKWKSA